MNTNGGGEKKSRENIQKVTRYKVEKSGFEVKKFGAKFKGNLLDHTPTG